MNRKLTIALLLLTVASLAGVSSASAQVIYSTTIQPIFDTSCNISGCHPTAGVDLTNFTSVMASKFNGVPIVQPFNATNSTLYQAVTGTNGMTLMPLGCTSGTNCLSTAQITSIKDWINQGAQNLTPAQNGTIAGNVTNASSGMAIPGATVTAVATGFATIGATAAVVTPTAPIVTGPQLVLTLNASSSGSKASNFTSAVLLNKTGAIVESASSISADGLTTTFNLAGIMPDFYFIEVNGLSGDRVPTFIDNNATNISQLVTKGLTTTTVGDATNPAKYRIKARSGGRHPIVNYFTGENETGLPFVIVYNDTSPGKIEVREVNTSRLLTSFTPSSLSDTIHASLEAGVTFQSWQLNLGASLPGFTGLLNHGQIYNNTDSLCNSCHINMNTKPANYSDVGTGFGGVGSGWCFKCHYGGNNGGDTNGFVDPTVVVAANGTIAGNVTNVSSGLAISGATVTANGMMATTNANGSYSISIAAGTYTVTASATGYQTNTTTGVVVTPGNVTTQDFALTPAVVVPPSQATFNISGFKVNDTDGNNIWEPGEMGIENWNIMLLNATTGTQIASTSTDSKGFYQFMNLAPGVYNVTEEMKSGFTPSGATFKVVTIENMDVKDVDFLNHVTVPAVTNNISGFKINDLNGNGKQDAGEKGLSGWNIRLIGIVPETVGINKETITDDQGFYSFENLPAGMYLLVETLKGGYVPTGSPVLAVNLANGMNSMNNNFMNRPVSSLIPDLSGLFK